MVTFKAWIDSTTIQKISNRTVLISFIKKFKVQSEDCVHKNVLTEVNIASSAQQV